MTHRSSIRFLERSPVLYQHLLQYGSLLVIAQKTLHLHCGSHQKQRSGSRAAETACGFGKARLTNSLQPVFYPTVYCTQKCKRGRLSGTRLYVSLCSNGEDQRIVRVYVEVSTCGLRSASLARFPLRLSGFGCVQT